MRKRSCCGTSPRAARVREPNRCLVCWPKGALLQNWEFAQKLKVSNFRISRRFKTSGGGLAQGYSKQFSCLPRKEANQYFAILQESDEDLQDSVAS